MPVINHEEVVFTLIKDEISACAAELGISQEQVAYGILKGMRRIVDLELGYRPVAETSILERVPYCPLSLDCYPSCAWWHNGGCAFQEEMVVRKG